MTELLLHCRIRRQRIGQFGRTTLPGDGVGTRELPAVRGHQQRAVARDAAA